MDSSGEVKIICWSIFFIISGAVSFLFPQFMSTIWGTILISIGVFSIIFREPAIYVIFSILYLFIALTNFLSGAWIATGIQVALAIWFFVSFVSSMHYYKKTDTKRFKFLLISFLALLAVGYFFITSLTQLDFSAITSSEAPPEDFVKKIETAYFLIAVGTAFGLASFLSEYFSKILSAIIALANLAFLGLTIGLIVFGLAFAAPPVSGDEEELDEEEYVQNEPASNEVSEPGYFEQDSFDDSEFKEESF